jgi:BMFP domain-containing protein YqiC
METSESRHRETIQKLEARIAELEKTSAGKRAPSS